MNTESVPVNLDEYSAGVGDLFIMLGRSARLSASYLKDKLLNKSATNEQEIPWCFEAVTPEWFTAVLCRNFPAAKVESVRLGIGHNGTSGRQQYLLTYNQAGQEAGLPSSIFAKGTPTITNRISMTAVPSMKIENQFFNCVRPELNIEAPMGFHSAYDLRSGRSIHLLEDLVATKQATFPQVDTLINREQIENVIDVISDLHAPYYQNPRLQTDLAGLMSWPENVRRMCLAMDIQKYHFKGLEKARPVLPDLVLEHFDETWVYIIKAVESHRIKPQTLCHIDVHLGNWYMFAGNKMGLLDWQCLNRAHWSHDFAYAVSALLTVDNRREWEEDLMRLYLQMMKDKQGIGITFDEAWMAYRQSLFGPLQLWTPTYSPPFFAPDNMQPEELSLELIKRITHAIADLDSFAALA